MGEEGAGGRKEGRGRERERERALRTEKLLKRIV